MSSELTLSSSCGCRGDFTKDAIALYGVRACSSDCEHTFDLVPTFAELIAESFRENYHVAPTCIFDIGPCAFYAKKAGTYVYVTWAYYKRPLDFDVARRWALTREIYSLRGQLWR